MLTRRTMLACALLASSSRCWGQAAPNSSEILKRYAGILKAAPGLVVATLRGRDRKVAVYGQADASGGRALDGETVFGIASLTKLFTALLLADMVLRGDVAMDDPVEKYLPAGVTIGTLEGKAPTLLDLATYTPGLPGWPPNLGPLNPARPFPAYSEQNLYAALNGHPLKFAPGTHYEYSNFGFGLLAHVLARRGGKSFDDMLASRICAPLGMTSTHIALTPSMRARLAPAHGDQGKPVAAWEFPEPLAGAGALFSTANDLLKFLEAATGRRKTALTPAFLALLKVRRPGGQPDTQAAAGWFVSALGGAALVWKDGATVGYSSFMGYAPDGTGIILLANGQCGDTLTPLGQHLLNADFPFPG